VAAGIGRTYGIDVTLVRIAFVVAAVFWVGIPAYLIGWAVIPSEHGNSAAASALHRASGRDIGLWIGLALVGAGALIAAEHIVPWNTGGGVFGSLLLIAGGVAILVLRHPSAEDDEDVDDAPAAVEDAETPAPESEPVSQPELPTAPVTEPVTEPVSAWTQTAEWPTARATRRDARRERRSQRPRPFLTPLTLSLLLIGGGVTSLLEATGAIDVNLTVALAIATCFVGAVLVLSAWVGRARGLIAIGVLLTVATAIAATLDVPLRGGIGEKLVHPTTVADVHRHYELGIGHMRLTLVDLPLVDRTTDITATVGIGRLEVNVPSTVTVEVDAHVGAGARKIFGFQTDGWQRDDHFVVAGSGPGLLRLHLRVGAGEIDVHRYEPDGAETLINGGGMQ
jgi:phage shock protein PspC (stress-responsive transcriptional regulator)